MFKKAFSVSVAKPNVRRGNRGRIAVKSLRIGGPGNRLSLRLGCSWDCRQLQSYKTRIVVVCRFLKEGMVWEIVAGTYSSFGVCHSCCEDPFLLFNDKVTVHFHVLRVFFKMLLHWTCSSELVGKGGWSVLDGSLVVYPLSIKVIENSR